MNTKRIVCALLTVLTVCSMSAAAIAESSDSELDKFLNAGVGAAATVAEKAGELFDAMAEKGEAVLAETEPEREALMEKSKQLANELADSFKRFFEDSQESISVDLFDDVLNEMPDEALRALRDKIDALLSERDAGQ